MAALGAASGLRSQAEAEGAPAPVDAGRGVSAGNVGKSKATGDYLRVRQPDAIEIGELRNGNGGESENYADIETTSRASTEHSFMAFTERLQPAGGIASQGAAPTSKASESSSTSSEPKPESESASGTTEAGAFDGGLDGSAAEVATNSSVTSSSGSGVISRAGEVRSGLSPAAEDLPVLFPRPYEAQASDSRLMLFFPIEAEEAGSLSTTDVLVPIYDFGGFSPPAANTPRSSATYRRVP